MQITELKVGTLPSFLQDDINALINAINSGKRLYDCELSEVLSDINQCESCHLIDSFTARILRNYYIKKELTCKDCARFNNDMACYACDEDDSAVRDGKLCSGFIEKQG